MKIQKREFISSIKIKTIKTMKTYDEFLNETKDPIRQKQIRKEVKKIIDNVKVLLEDWEDEDAQDFCHLLKNELDIYYNQYRKENDKNKDND
jgi:ElaB/YqjD/DUF883 family membrane-anchored ribosome-binding protein